THLHSSPQPDTTRPRGRAGRNGLLIVLVCLAAVSVAVQWRRVEGTAQLRELRDLERQRRALHAREITLKHEIRRATSRGVIVPLGEAKLGLHVPKDMEV